MKLEIRSIAVELRAIDEAHPRRLRGMPIVYDAEADLFDFVERIKPGALTSSLNGTRNIRARFEHRDLLGSRANGSLKLFDTPKGLEVEIDVAETRAGDDALALVQRGDITGMSFGFITRAQDFTKVGEKLYRDITDLDLYEVTVTDSPAYGQSSVEARSVDQAAIDAARTMATLASLSERRRQLRRQQAAA